MTCIVSYRDEEGRVYLGGDSAAVETSQLYARVTANPKVFRKGPYLIGYTSSFRMGQLLQYTIDLPKPHGDLHEFMCTEFILEIRKGFKDHGYSTVHNNEEKGGTFIVAVNGRMFEIEDDFQIGEFAENYNACGCGREYALAVFHALEDVEGFSPEEVVTKALEAAEHFSIGVKAPFEILKD